MVEGRITKIGTLPRAFYLINPILESSNKKDIELDNDIQKLNIDGIGYIPPTVRREIQFISELEKDLNLNLSKLQIFKVKSEIAVPQKILNKLEDLIENAQNTFVVDNSKRFKNILLIDDAVGSGATLNESAKKLRDYNICSGKIIGLSITGSFKGYDVVSKVADVKMYIMIYYNVY